jgi:hypothetical protein
MHDDPHKSHEPVFPSEEMVNASELREFLFCERAWFLNRQRFRVSPEAQSQRAAGVVFHEARAAAAQQGRNPQTYWWALILALAGIALLLLNVLMSGR